MATVPSLCFSRLLGQDKARRMIHRSLVAGRLPHAYMFRGPDGVGKSLFARALAAAVNCRATDRVEACGACSSCRKFNSMNHPDYLVIQPEKGTIKIDRIRKLTRDLDYAPFESAMRVTVLEDVHAMRREAANSLLKTLEEPPPGNLLILTADSSREVLSTLTSRCQVVPFSSLSASDTTQILVHLGMGREEAQLFARLSEGSPGVSLVLHKKEIVSLLKEAVAAVSDPTVEPESDISVLLLLAEKMAALNENLPTLLGLFRLWLRDLLVGDGEVTSHFLRGNFKPKGWSSDQLFAKLHAIAKAEEELARNCNRTLVCEVLLFALQR
jgi:DNA polymerase-3 subunit delta'